MHRRVLPLCFLNKRLQFGRLIEADEENLLQTFHLKYKINNNLEYYKITVTQIRIYVKLRHDGNVRTTFKNDLLPTPDVGNNNNNII